MMYWRLHSRAQSCKCRTDDLLGLLCLVFSLSRGKRSYPPSRIPVPDLGVGNRRSDRVRLCRLTRAIKVIMIEALIYGRRNKNHHSVLNTYFIEVLSCMILFTRHA